MSNGINYNGSYVEYGKYLNIEFDPADIEQPVVDMTPGPAISSFTFYNGNAFTEWQGDMLVGSLAARELYRVRLDAEPEERVEKILENVGR